MNKLIINSKNLENNIKVIKSKIGDTKLCAMVKADAYGHSAGAITTLLKDKVDYFGVANIEEAIEIRENSITNNILVVGNTEFDNYSIAEQKNIEITVSSIKQLEYIAKNNPNIRFHLKINTGMNRLGITDYIEFRKAIDYIMKHKLNFVGVFTHFSASGVDNKYTEIQFSKFQKFISVIEDKNIIKHCANSDTVNLGKEYFLDMVRIGIGFYGSGFKKSKNLMTMKAKVIHINTVEKGDYISYSKSYRANKRCQVAVVNVGYADGINRKLSGKIKVIINGKKYKQIGNICMDMLMVAVDKKVCVGNDAIIEIEGDKWAKLCNTISYEIFTSINKRRFNIEVE